MDGDGHEEGDIVRHGCDSGAGEVSSGVSPL